MPDFEILDKIGSPRDLKDLNYNQLDVLCSEIRTKLIDTVSKNGGHLSSNLGAVELTVALHKVFNTPDDQIVWDVSHQCYDHKMLTGRFDSFDTIRQEGGISGFTKISESEYDSFGAGHASTSISAALGLAKAKTIQGKKDFTIAVIGDGSLTGGLAYEALNNAGRGRDRLIIVLNDNKMSISRNVGAVARHLAITRSKPLYFRIKNGIERFIMKIPKIGKGATRRIIKLKALIKSVLYNNTLFENMGFAYLGPIDGHDMKTLCQLLESSKTMSRPVVLHVCTVKGKGYSFAEENPDKYHGISGFNKETGEVSGSCSRYAKAFGETLCDIAESNDKICAITAAMKPGTGLTEFAEKYRGRFFDVGIAESHAATFAAGLARNGMIPVFAVYSTFAQRSYDQILHDCAIQNLHVIFCIDHAGIVGSDGETHQGIFDAAFLNSIPNITIYTPATVSDLRMSIYKAVDDTEGVAVVRYPCGNYNSDARTSYEYCDCEISGKAAPTAIVSYGRVSINAVNAASSLKRDNIPCFAIKLNRIKPVPEEAVQAAIGCKDVFFFEEGIKAGGIGEHFLALLTERGFEGKYHLTGVGDEFVQHSTIESAIKKYNLDERSMTAIVKTGMNDRNKQG